MTPGANARRALLNCTGDRPGDGGTRFFIQKAQSLSAKERREMIEPHPQLSMVRQCVLVAVSLAFGLFPSPIVFP